MCKDKVSELLDQIMYINIYILFVVGISFLCNCSCSGKLVSTRTPSATAGITAHVCFYVCIYLYMYVYTLLSVCL